MPTRVCGQETWYPSAFEPIADAALGVQFTKEFWVQPLLEMVNVETANLCSDGRYIIFFCICPNYAQIMRIIINRGSLGLKGAFIFFGWNFSQGSHLLKGALDFGLNIFTYL